MQLIKHSSMKLGKATIKEWLTMLAIAVMIGVVMFWLYFPDRILARFNGDEAMAGAYGDIFGAVNALFTSLAFALLIYTALMRREELKLQRKELEQTRKHR